MISAKSASSTLTLNTSFSCYAINVDNFNFHPIVETWFLRRFGEPTQAQIEGWPAISKGHHTLISAPTGSGKTLAAFLNAIDALVRQGIEQGELKDETQVVYVSPLKALSNDVHKNLVEPLAEITELSKEMGTPIPEIRVAVRTGDTSQKERTLNAKKPAHILITTPESLFIVLTSESGRRALTKVHTLILDELHALVPNKRGSHLAITAQRLSENSSNPVTRIGLSATQNPIQEVANFMVGYQVSDVVSNYQSVKSLNNHLGSEGSKYRSSALPCTVVEVTQRKEIDIKIELPKGEELGPIATHSQWEKVLDQIAAHSVDHSTTLVFVNTRRLVERVAHLLSERLGEDQVVAHHGSLSKETRLMAEQRLKEGTVDVCVATASLELGIDIGNIDLVVQIGSPRNIGVSLQRIGRSAHHLGGIPKAFFYPLTRDELVETVALHRAIFSGKLDRIKSVEWPLDILAQQIVAICVREDWWDEVELFNFLRTTYPYRNLPFGRYKEVLDVLVEGVSGRWGRNGAYLYRDGVNGLVKSRRGGRIATITSGGAIPDTADYLVVSDPEGSYVGSVNEDFAIESNIGDIFLLGNSPWKVRRVEAGVVRVQEAHGQSPTIPFWLGEAPGRTLELSKEVSRLREEVNACIDLKEKPKQRLIDEGFDTEVVDQIFEYIVEGIKVLGQVPTCKNIVAERFFDETGGMQLVIHSPFGSRINRAWGMALRKRFCRNFDFELQASATDEGINLSLGPQHSFPLEDVFNYVKPHTAENLLTQAILQSPIFGIRWRWVASRALALLRNIGGKRVPTAIQRMRAEDLIAAVFPEQVACQDNSPAAMDVEIPEHPLVFETIRDCLNEAFDLPGMVKVLEEIEAGDIKVSAKDTVQPSVFSHQVLNAMPYAFLDNAPLEERRARAVSLRRALPEDAKNLGTLDPLAITEETKVAWPTARDPDELHDALMTLIVLTDSDISTNSADPHLWREWLAGLEAKGRVMRLNFSQVNMWLATERSGLVNEAYPKGKLSDSPWDSTQLMGEEEAVLSIVRARAESSGPFTTIEMATDLALELSSIEIAVAKLETMGVLLRGNFRAVVENPKNGEYCDRRILARIHSATIGKLRREIEPVPASVFLQFLFEWQHVAPDTKLSGEAGLLKVVEQMQGFESAAYAWERSILPLRVEGYVPSYLDSLFFNGEAIWGRFTKRLNDSDQRLSRNSSISIGLRSNLNWLLDLRIQDDEPLLSGTALEVYSYLQVNGASFFTDIAEGVNRLPLEVEQGLWQLVSSGNVTADGFGALRSLISGVRARTRRGKTRYAFSKGGLARIQQSRWSILNHKNQNNTEAFKVGSGNHGESFSESRASQLLQRYGIVCKEILARESMAPQWRVLLRVFRKAEARGEIRGGRFIAGFAGEQFAFPEAIERLRKINKAPSVGKVIRISSNDPLNLVGILTPGPRVASSNGGDIIFRDGVPISQDLLDSGD